MEFLRGLLHRSFKRKPDEDDEDDSVSQKDWDLVDRCNGTLFGNCIGDAIGLLTEFLTKEDAKMYYGKLKNLEFEHKVMDMHRNRWEIGDWTDDSDQMILIMESILANDGKIDPVDFAKRIHFWRYNGFPDLGDMGGNGVGSLTDAVIRHPEFQIKPHFCAEYVWDANQRRPAPNGAVMRTSILGVYQYDSIEKVIENTINICKVIHHDPRCQASCVAVTTAIALMLQRDPECVNPNGTYNIKAITNKSFEYAKTFLTDEDGVAELKKHMFASSIKDLVLDESRKIGYTYKTMGAGFWALRQKDFRKALTTIVMEAGDADTNGAVAGAMLGCKLGYKRLPSSWVSSLKHKDWFQEKVNRLLKLVIPEEDASKVTKRKAESEKADEADSGEKNPPVEEDEKDTPRTEGQEEPGKDSNTGDNRGDNHGKNTEEQVEGKPAE